MINKKHIKHLLSKIYSTINCEVFSMKKQNIINLVKYYADRNDSAFKGEVATIASVFEKNG